MSLAPTPPSSLPRRLAALLQAAALGLIVLGTSHSLRGADPKPSPKPSGPQVDGAFHKVILDTDRDQDGDGQPEDTVVNPMEIALAPDGRVFFIERAGLLKVWNPKTRATTVAGTLKVYTELEDGLLGIALDPKFARNPWIYLFYSVPETPVDADGHKTGVNRVSRFTLRDGTLDLASEKVLLSIPTQRDQCWHSAG